METRRTQMRERFDADGDGVLSEEERKTARETMQTERRARVLEKFDADGDGKLSDDEKAKARAEMGPPPEGRKPPNKDKRPAGAEAADEE